jgi:hypothetical protein
LQFNSGIIAGLPPAGLIDSAYRLSIRKSTLTFKTVVEKLICFPNPPLKLIPLVFTKVETSLLMLFQPVKISTKPISSPWISTVFSFHNFLAHQPEAFFAVR